MCRGIILKFCCDKKFEDKWMFCRKETPDHLLAQKIAQSELRAYQAMMDYILEHPTCNIHIPICCTVKYRGYLISAGYVKS